MRVGITNEDLELPYLLKRINTLYSMSFHARLINRAFHAPQLPLSLADLDAWGKKSAEFSNRDGRL